MSSKNKTISAQDYGVDVAIRRADDLDKLMLDWVEKNKKSKVLDLGCGAGGQSLRLVQSGGQVTAVDIVDYSDEFEKLRQENSLSENFLHFLNVDVNSLESILKNKKFDICCLQRVIHYLSYDEALNLLVYLRRITQKKLYISVTGLESDIGHDYFDKNKPVKSRFCKLDAEQAEKFYINKPVCLYTKNEFKTLLIKSGWKIEKCWVSAFGNIKAVCN